MNRDALKELDVVALTVDLPDQHLYRGHVGTIVYVHGPGSFEVEFVDIHGRTYAVAALDASQLLQLHHEPLAA